MTGREFKIKRVTLDMTQAQIAVELGLQSNTVSRYETGDLNIPKTVELAIETLERRYNEKEEQAGVKVEDDPGTKMSQGSVDETTA
jgi:transcriptional regulator with XRE-family HTH domain